MTQIDLTKSKFLLPELRKVIAGLIQLNSVDTSLKRVVEKLYSYIEQPHDVNVEEFKAIVNVTQIISQSYGKETGVFSRALNHIMEELDFLALSYSLLKSEGKYLQLVQKINDFHILAMRG